MDKRRVMVQLADPEWTREAMHLACAIGYRNQTDVVLVRFLPVPSMGLIGEHMADTKLSKQDQITIRDCTSIASEYNVPLDKVDFEFYALTDALADAALHVNAAVLFATVPRQVIPYWHRFEVWNLRRKLSRASCTLYTLESSDKGDTSVPRVIVRTSHKKWI